MSSGTEVGSAPVMLNPSEFPKPLGYNPFPNTLQPYIVATLFETFLYGIYSVLFAICIYILIRRRQSLHWLLAVLAGLMFAIATADMGYTMHLLFQRLLKGSLTFQDMKPKYWLFVSNNILADSTLFYRCYVVWGGNLKIMVLPVLLFISSMVCGYLFEGSTSNLFAYSWVYVVLTFVLNVFLTGLIAGRIWWLSWKGRTILDRKLQKRYYVALAIVLESGLLTSVYMLPDLILTSIILDNGFVQVVGIVPTLIVVQVGLGRAVKLVEEASEETLEPIAVAEFTTRAGTDTNMNHTFSFYSDKQTGTVRSKCGRCGSIVDYQDQIRTGEDRITIEENPPEPNRREKSLQRDIKQEESDPGWDIEKMLELRNQVNQPSELDRREDAS